MLPTLLLLVFSLLSATEASEPRTIQCNLVASPPTTDDAAFICQIEPSSLNLNLSASQSSPLHLDATSRLVWLNRFQPTWTRWSQLCSPRFKPTSSLVCVNSHDCDSTGTCRLQLFPQQKEASTAAAAALLELRDNIDSQAEPPKFPVDLRLLNVSWELDSTSSADELLLLEHTDRLDSLRSKPNRMLMRFSIEQPDRMPAQLAAHNCRLDAASFFDLRFDNLAEKLYLTMRERKSHEIVQKDCFVLRLSVKRSWPSEQDEPLGEDQSTLVMVNLNDNRFDRPIFERSVYDFTLDENTQLGAVIGQLKATYLRRPSDNDRDESSTDESSSSSSLIKYRIVPFIEDADQSSMVFLAGAGVTSDEADIFSSGLPVRIDPDSGRLSVRLNVDREKFISDARSSVVAPSVDHAKLGLIKFNVEASFASTSYSYAKVNIFIRDVNDNPPVARIRPINRQKGHQSDTESLTVSEDASINQILAYVGVYDPDSGENGTIRSIDLSLVSAQRPSSKSLQLRRSKLNRMKTAGGVSEALVGQLEAQLDELEDPALSGTEPSQNEIPVRLSKIGDKLLTLQLSRKLDFERWQSYVVEMRIRDNGTRPQLESKTRVSFNILGQNKHAPVFLNAESAALVTILDGSPVKKNESIFRFEAIDLDEDKNGLVRYVLVRNPFVGMVREGEDARAVLDSTLELDPTSGHLKLLRPLDRESFVADCMDVFVMAIDQAEEAHKRLNSTFKLTVKIADSNDNSPTFSATQLNLTVLVEPPPPQPTVQHRERFVRVSPRLDLIDLDSLAANSANFLNVNLNEARENLFENAVHLDQTIKFDAESCYKSFRLELLQLNASSKSHPFLVMVQETDSGSSVKCQVALWLDVEALDKCTAGQFEYRFVLKAQDYGVHVDEDDAVALLELAVRVDFKPLDAVRSTTTTREIDLKQSLATLDSFVDLDPGQELLSIVKLVQNQAEHKIKQVESISKFRVVDNFLTLAEKETIEAGVYLIDAQSGSGGGSLNQIELIVHDSSHSRDQLKQLLEDFKSQSMAILTDNEPKFRNTVDRFSSLSQFETLLLGVSALTFVPGGSGSSTAGGDFTSNGTNIWSIVLHNRSTFVKFMALTIVVSFAVLTLFVCCILLLIRRNCSKAASARNAASLEKACDHKDLNVVDDESSSNENSGGESSSAPAGNAKKVMSKLSRLSSGFARLIVCEESSSSSSPPPPTSSKQIDDKVTQYLNGLESVVVSFKSAAVLNEMISSSSPASSGSLVDSKKNLIIPAVVTPPAAGSQPQQQPQTSVCTLSTTSSSCISDEGCYGSSDFSSEKDSHLKQQKQQQQQYKRQQLQLSAAGSKPAYTPSAAKFYHQNYYINNLTRFEKIYNELGNPSPPQQGNDRISPYLVKPDSSISTSPSSSNGPSPSRFQVVTSISGSYV